MNFEHAVQTIAKRGFTDRQARFLVLVARHSGVCVMRQYSSFAGIVFGQKTRKFFANLVRLGFVSTYDCAHNRGRVYHVRHRAIYEAIGEPDSRLRRPPGVPRALERLMLLDAILENPESIWMSSSTEKLGYLASRGISADDAPHLSIRQGDQRRVRYFPDRLPIGVHPSGHVVVVYLHADPMHDEFRDFLQRHAPLLENLPLDDSHRGSTSPRRGSGQASEERVGTTRVAVKRARTDRAAVVLRSPHRRPCGAQRTCRSAPI